MHISVLLFPLCGTFKCVLVRYRFDYYEYTLAETLILYLDFASRIKISICNFKFSTLSSISFSEKSEVTLHHVSKLEHATLFGQCQ